MKIVKLLRICSNAMSFFLIGTDRSKGFRASVSGEDCICKTPPASRMRGNPGV